MSKKEEEIREALRFALEIMEQRHRRENPSWDGYATADSAIGRARLALDLPLDRAGYQRRALAYINEIGARH